MNVSKHKLNTWVNHFQRLIDYAKYDISNTREANVVRLAKRDVKMMRKLIDKSNHGL